MRTIDRSTRFKRDYKRELKGRHRATLDADFQPVLAALATDTPLDPNYRDHDLSGDWAGYRDCHVKPDLVLIPIGGHYVMDPKAAAYATKELIKPKMAWPMHYASNPFLRGTPAEYKEALGQSSIEVIDAVPGTKKQF